MRLLTDMILVITNKDDVTTDLVIDKLNNSGDIYYRFNTEELCKSVNLVFRPKEKEFALLDSKKNKAINLNNVASVYFRRPKLSAAPVDLTQGEQRFVLNEIDNTLEGLYQFLNPKFWISNVYSIRQAENKLYQQLIAEKFGLVTPRSIVTNDYNEAVDFVKLWGDCIIKPIKTGFVDDASEPKVIFTSPITVDNLSSLERIVECPTYLQVHVRKVADIRVTVVGRSIFSARINSQSCEETQVDWRRGENVHLSYEPVDLGDKLNEACINLMKFLGLNFGALDFILDEKGKFVFLEINPNGQWGWIQFRLNYDIAGTIAKLLREPNA